MLRSFLELISVSTFIFRHSMEAGKQLGILLSSFGGCFSQKKLINEFLFLKIMP